MIERSVNILDAEDLYTSRVLKPVSFYGIEFLDNALLGIMESDLVLIGARAGAGKTEIANLIAQTNAKTGKRVRFYALEAELNEQYVRMLFREVCSIYYKNNRDYIRYSEFFLGMYDILLKKEIAEARQILRNRYLNLNIIYKEADEITVEILEKDINDNYFDTDLFVLDHIHYVDSDDEVEAKAIKKLMKTLRNCTLVNKKPIVAISHLRKKDRGNKDLVPDLDEFHGSSDITKIATKVITLAPYYDEATKESYRNPTLMRICKNRVDGSVCKYIAKLIFNSKNNTYETGYDLGLSALCVKEFVSLKDQFPVWKKEVDNARPVIIEHLW